MPVKGELCSLSAASLQDEKGFGFTFEMVLGGQHAPPKASLRIVAFFVASCARISSTSAFLCLSSLPFRQSQLVICQKFSNVSTLEIFLYKICIELTFENFPFRTKHPQTLTLHCTHIAFQLTNILKQPLLSIHMLSS